MDKKSIVFYLDNTKTDSVSVIWEDGWKNTKIYRNKVLIKEVSTKEDLKFGCSFHSSDGKVLFIQLKGGLFRKPYLDLLVNGRHYTYIEPTTLDYIHKIYKSILLVVFFNITLGLLGALDFDYAKNMGFGYHSVIYGLIFLGLGIAFRYKKSLTSVLIMTVIMLIELVIYIMANSHLDFLDINLQGFLVRLSFVLLFIKGGFLITKYKKEIKTQANKVYKT